MGTVPESCWHVVQAGLPKDGYTPPKPYWKGIRVYSGTWSVNSWIWGSEGDPKIEVWESETSTSSIPRCYYSLTHWTEKNWNATSSSNAYDLLKPRVWGNFSRDACSCRETWCGCSMARFGICFSFIKLKF